MTVYILEEHTDFQEDGLGGRYPFEVRPAVNMGYYTSDKSAQAAAKVFTALAYQAWVEENTLRYEQALQVFQDPNQLSPEEKLLKEIFGEERPGVEPAVPDLSVANYEESYDYKAYGVLEIAKA